MCKPVQGDDQSLAEGIQRVALGGADEITFGIEGAPDRESPFLGEATMANSNGVDLSTFWIDLRVGQGREAPINHLFRIPCPCPV